MPSGAAALGPSVIGMFKTNSLHANKVWTWPVGRPTGGMGATVLVPVSPHMTYSNLRLVVIDSLTGISLGQGYAYTQWFPNERRSLKLVVGFDFNPQIEFALTGSGIEHFVIVYLLSRICGLLTCSIRVIDVFQTAMSLGVIWFQLISCRRNLSYACTVKNPW